MSRATIIVSGSTLSNPQVREEGLGLSLRAKHFALGEPTADVFFRPKPKPMPLSMYLPAIVFDTSKWSAISFWL